LNARLQKCSDAFASPQEINVTLVGVGWAQYASDVPFVPVICVVSNAQDEDGEWLGEAQPRFVTRFYGMADDQRVMLWTTGQHVALREKHNILRNAYKCISKGAGPEAILTLLADRIRRVADRKPTVGRNLMAMSLPIESAGSDMYTAARSLPQPNMPSFFFWPEHETNFVQGSPWIVNEFFIAQLESLQVQRDNGDPNL
jgi:hypothetical protein